MVPKTKSDSNKLMIADLITKQDLIEHFKGLGLQRGMVVYVQSSMEYFSYVCGGNQTIIEALQDVIGYEGSLCCASYTPDNLDPLSKDSKQFAPYQVEIVRDALPPFHKKLTRSNSDFANQLMLFDGVFRSNHPLYSYVAWGKYAKLICDKHPLHFALSKESPLGKVAELNGYTLLLGVKCEAADIFKLARVNDVDTPIRIVSSPIEKKVHKSFISMLDYELRPKDLHEISAMLDERQIVNETYIGRARCRLFSSKEALTLASAYLHTHKEG